LRDQLLALSQSVAATAPDLSRKLEALADKLSSVEASAQLAAQLTPTVAAADPDATTIAHLIRTLLGEPDRSGEPPRADANGDAAVAANRQHADELLQVLAQLGLSTTPVSATATPTASVAASGATVASVSPPLLRLSNQLTQVSTALADTHPELAKKLEAFASRIVSTDVDANILGQITSAAKPGGDATALDRLVQSLIEGKPVQAPPTSPATSPQIASTASLAIPASIAPKPTKPAVTEVKAAQPEPASVTAGSASESQPRMTLAAARETVTRPDPDPKPDPKTASVIVEAAKSEASPSNNAPAQPAQAASAVQQARAIPAAYQAAANPINMGQVAFEMVRQVQQGTSRFTIRLDPPELGRVDVRMHVDNSGAVNARLTVDRPETLDLFQRDRQSLERALAQAGLDAGKTNLEFSLRQNHQNPFSGMMGGDQRQQQFGNRNAPRFSLNDNDEIAAMPAVTLYRGLASAGGVNIVA
jgi:flagellar hook-length control protein FliK